MCLGTGAMNDALWSISGLDLRVPAWGLTTVRVEIE